VDESRFAAIVRQLVPLSTRRAALQFVGAGSIASAVTASELGRRETEAKKHRHNRKKKCKPPKGKCGKKCKPLNTNENCGRCGNRCEGEEACQDGVCCAQPLCRGECRAECPPPAAKVPFPQQLDYAIGAIKPNSRSQMQLNADVEAAYDRWKDFYLVGEDRDEDGNQIFRIAFGKPGTGKHDVTVSEGQGFGMVIVATMAGYDDEAREIFDGLWRFRLAHPSVIDPRLMDWRVPGGEGDDSAFDGDADIAYGLLLADAQWASNGAIDYLNEAERVIAGIRGSTIGPSSRYPMLGDWVDPNGSKYNQYTPRTSDFMPGHFRAFGNATGDGVWDDVVAACRNAVTTLQTEFSQNADAGPELTGLLPDFVQPVSSSNHSPQPASPGFLEGPHDGAYNYNAGRDPWRIGADALLNGDSTSAAQAGLIAIWAESKTGGDPQALRAGYELDGTPLPNSNYFTTFFVSPIGVAAMTQPGLQAWLNAIYSAVYNVSEDYYEDTVTLLCLLVMSGNFWDPMSPR
jgi:hypothetical protein